MTRSFGGRVIRSGELEDSLIFYLILKGLHHEISKKTIKRYEVASNGFFADLVMKAQ